MKAQYVGTVLWFKNINKNGTKMEEIKVEICYLANLDAVFPGIKY